MQATLLNFGENMRVIADSRNSQVTIGVGQMIETDIHQVHFDMISKAIARETLVAIPHDMVLTDKLRGIMQLMSDAPDIDLQELLRKFTDVLGPPPEGNIRPTRDMMRIALREVAREEVRKAMFGYYAAKPDALAPSRTFIREEGGPPRQDDRSDGVLDIAVQDPAPQKPVPQVIDRPKPKKRAIKRERL